MILRQLLVLALFTTTPLVLAADPKPEPGFLGGRIVGLTGQPINGAVVGYLGDSGKVPTTATGPDGRFKLGPIAPTAKPRFGIYVDADGLAREFVPAPPVLPGSTSDVGNIALVSGRRFAGKVTDDKGKPLPGVRVRCELLRRSNRYTVYSLGPDVESLTNADGTYDLPPLPIGTHSLRYEKDGWATFYKNLTVEPGPLAEALAVRMDAEFLVRGRIVDEAGKPIAGATIDPYDRKLKSDADGRYQIHGIGKQARFLMFDVDADGFVRGKVGAAAQDAEVVLKRAAAKKIPMPEVKPPQLRLEGSATRAGKPIPTGWAVLYRVVPYARATACCTMRNRPVIWEQIVYTEAEIRDGKFAFQTLTDAKDWYVALHEPNRAPSIHGPLTLSREKPTPFTATEPGRLTGKVPDRPEKLEGYLWVVAFSKNGHRAEARIGSNGTFSFPSLPPGEYGLKVGHDLYVDEEVTAEEPQAPGWKIQPPADPWKRAKIVAVASGKTTTVDDLTLPLK